MDRLCTVCAQSVHSLCTVCAQNVHNVCTIVHRVCTPCAHPVHTLCTLCTPCAHSVHTCAHSVHTLCTLCAHSVHTLCTLCARPCPHSLCTLWTWRVCLNTGNSRQTTPFNHSKPTFQHNIICVPIDISQKNTIFRPTLYFRLKSADFGGNISAERRLAIIFWPNDVWR